MFVLFTALKFPRLRRLTFSGKLLTREHLVVLSCGGGPAMVPRHNGKYGSWTIGSLAVATISALAGLLVILGPDPLGAVQEPLSDEPHVRASDPVAAGRYIITIAGCNDCHTPGYMEKGHEVPEAEWLTGLAIGWRGPWGTTYGSNLRRTVSMLSEDAFVEMMRTRDGRPPHPWPSVNAMSETDLRAIYRYIGTLQPVGEAEPDYLPPGQEPDPPFFLLDPDLAGSARFAEPQQ
jgi:hypothetical protein